MRQLFFVYAAVACEIVDALDGGSDVGIGEVGLISDPLRLEGDVRFRHEVCRAMSPQALRHESACSFKVLLACVCFRLSASTRGFQSSRRHRATEDGEAGTIGVWVCNDRFWYMAVVALRQDTRPVTIEEYVARLSAKLRNGGRRWRRARLDLSTSNSEQPLVSFC